MNEAVNTGLSIALFKKMKAWARGELDNLKGEVDTIKLTPGPRGAQGVPGQPGPIGDVGVRGKDGKDGERGSTGAQGDQGPKGDTGDAGPPGKDGKDGKNGTNGKDGARGAIGPAGRDGKNGINGKDGKIGSIGPVGPKGETGAVGSIGPAGKDGKNGNDGTNGRDGQPGPIGPPGKDGLNGKDGVDGKDGKDGADGRDGENPDISPIVDKLQKDFNLYRQKLNESLSTLGGGGSYHILDNADVERKALSQVTNNAILIYNVQTGKFVVSDIEEVILSLGLETGDAVKYKKLIDIAGDYTYIGEALPGTATSGTTWRIKEVYEDPSTKDMTILWADGTNDFIKKWDDRLTYSYS